MSKVMSTRVNESTFELINQIVRRKKISKKRIIEEAIRDFWQKIRAEKEIDLFESSFGSWKRDEPVDETVYRARKAFNRSMHRHHGQEAE